MLSMKSVSGLQGRDKNTGYVKDNLGGLRNSALFHRVAVKAE